MTLTKQSYLYTGGFSYLWQFVHCVLCGKVHTAVTVWLAEGQQHQEHSLPTIKLHNVVWEGNVIRKESSLLIDYFA